MTPSTDNSAGAGSNPFTLGVMFGLSALLASRLVLVGHEFLGHGGAAWLLGGEVRDHRLFLFGGGWVLTRVPERSLGGDALISLGGVGIELVLAVVALLWWRRRRRDKNNSTRSAIVSTAALIAAGVCFIHLGVYLSLGTHYGYGDGRLLHVELGGARVVAVALAAAFATASALWLTTQIRRELLPFLPSGARAVVVNLVVAVVVGATIHGGLMLGERAIVSDPTYREVMRGEAERRASAAVAMEAAARARAGGVMAPAELEARYRELADGRRPFPLRWPLYVAVGLAALLGFARSSGEPDPRRSTDRIRIHDLRTLAVATAMTIGVVALLWSPWWR